MEALRASYGADSEGSDTDDSPAAASISSRTGAKINSCEARQQLHPLPASLPPPPVDLLQAPDFPGMKYLFSSVYVCFNLDFDAGSKVHIQK